MCVINKETGAVSMGSHIQEDMGIWLENSTSKDMISVLDTTHGKKHPSVLQREFPKREIAILGVCVWFCVCVSFLMGAKLAHTAVPK